MRNIYIVKSKRTKSLAVPAKITKEHESIGFTLKVDRQTKALNDAAGTKVVKFKNIMIPAVESFEPSTQQVPSS